MSGKRNKKSDKKLVQREKSAVDSKESDLRGQGGQQDGRNTSSGSALKLYPDHLADLRKSGLSEKTLKLMGVYSLGAEGFLNNLVGFQMGWNLPWFSLTQAWLGFLG